VFFEGRRCFQQVFAKVDDSVVGQPRAVVGMMDIDQFTPRYWKRVGLTRLAADIADRLAEISESLQSRQGADE